MGNGETEVVRDERWAFDESFPELADALKSEEGFNGKAYENVGDDFRRKEKDISEALLILHISWHREEKRREGVRSHSDSKRIYFTLIGYNHI